MKQKYDDEILDAVFSRLRRLEGNDTQKGADTNTTETIFKKLRKIERRVDKLETWRNWVIGAAAGAGFAFGVFLKILGV